MKQSSTVAMATDHGRWMMDTVLPQWLRMARHPEGGLVSLVPFEGAANADAPRDLLVQARLAYCFAQAQMFGASGTWARDAAIETFDVILGPLRAENGGFRKRTLSASPRADDAIRDFYDHTFVIFAAAWLFRLTADPRYNDVAHEVMGLFDEQMAHPAGGYCEAVEEVDGPRRQNPHMHLLEALLAAYDATPDASWLARARGIVDLFLDHFHDRATNTVIEFLTDDLVPVPGEKGQWREPGHQFEWAWLLLEYHQKTADDRVLKPANDIYQAALTLGVEDVGDVPGVVEGTDGISVLSRNRLLWPQTEYVKALVKQFQMTGDKAALERADAALKSVRKVFFAPSDPLWRNVVQPDGSSEDTTVPTRVLYHLVFAIAEFERAHRAL